MGLDISLQLEIGKLLENSGASVKTPDGASSREINDRNAPLQREGVILGGLSKPFSRA